MIYRGPGFSAFVWLGSSSVSKLNRRHIGGDKMLTGDGEGGGEWGAKSYYGEKDWSSINHSILFEAKKSEKRSVSHAFRLFNWNILFEFFTSNVFFPSNFSQQGKVKKNCHCFSLCFASLTFCFAKPACSTLCEAFKCIINRILLV